MSSQKYSVQVTQQNDGWKAEILRRASARKTVVSKQHEGFATEAEAHEWGKQMLEHFQQQQAEHNKRKAARR